MELRLVDTTHVQETSICPALGQAALPLKKQVCSLELLFASSVSLEAHMVSVTMCVNLQLHQVHQHSLTTQFCSLWQLLINVFCVGLYLKMVWNLQLCAECCY